MIKNIINFAELNPWTIGFTLLSLVLFVITLFLINGKKVITKNAKLEKTGSNIFMIFIIIILVCYILVIGTTPSFATLIDKGYNAILIYWLSIFALWGTIKYITGIDLEEVLDDIL